MAHAADALHKRTSVLSERERQVLGMAASGMLDKQIAQELGLSQNTLRTYWRRVRDKLGELPRTALVSGFVREDLRLAETEGLDQFPPEGVVLDVINGTMLAADSVNDIHKLQRGVPHPLVAYSHIYHPEDRDAARRVIYDVIEGRLDSAHVIFRLVPDTGVEILSVSFHSVRDASGRVTKVYGYRVRALDCREGHSPDVRVGTWLRWADSEVLTIDADLAGMLELPGAGTYSRSEVYNRIHPDDHEDNRCAAEIAAAKGDDWFQQDARIVGSDGATRWIRTRGRLVKGTYGRVRIVGDAIMFQ
jgi:DNA-binding CsgD family transcriptional regulator